MNQHELIVRTDGSWFQVGEGACVDLRSRSKYRMLLGLLVREHLRDPLATLSVNALIDQIWPGERLHHHVARNRAYVALCSLRKWGLEGLLLRTPDGYQLDPQLRVRLVDDPFGGSASLSDGAVQSEASPAS